MHCPAIPYWVGPVPGIPILDHITATLIEPERRAGRRPSRPRTTGCPPNTRSTARRTSRTSSSSTSRFRVVRPAMLGRPRRSRPTGSRSTSRTSSRCRGPPTGTCTRTRRASSSPLPDTEARHRRDEGFLADDRELRPCRTTSSSSRRSSAKRAGHFDAEFGDVWTAEELGAAPASRAPVRDRHEHPCVSSSRSPPATAPCASPPAPSRCSQQDPQTKELTPVSDPALDDGPAHHASTEREDPAWLYALQAAKTSITVWGIWLGHVYHLHIATAAMQMTMYNHLPADHVLRPLLEPQSQSSHRFRFRPAHDPLSEDLPAHAGQRPPCARQAPRPVRCEGRTSSATTRTPS